MDNKKFLIILFSSFIAFFLGSFFAFQAIFGNFEKNSSSFTGIDDSFSQMDKMIEEHQKILDQFNKDIDHFMNKNNTSSGIVIIDNQGIKTINSAIVSSEETKDSYRILVDLKPFNKDEKNIGIKVKNKTVQISAQYKSKDDNKFNYSQFYQTLSIPEKLNMDDIKREKYGDKLVITIPKKNVQAK